MGVQTTCIEFCFWPRAKKALGLGECWFRRASRWFSVKPPEYTMLTEGAPVILRSRESLGNHYPCHGIHREAVVTAINLDVLGLFMTVCLQTNAPIEHAVKARINGGGRHRWR